MNLIEKLLHHPKPATPTETYSLRYNCGQPYSIEYYKDQPNSTYKCHDCGQIPPIINRYTIIHGNSEPYGSLYYCPKHQLTIQKVNSDFLEFMGFAH
jgi:hypothetical protein